MKKYIIEEKMKNKFDGYFQVIIEGETHLNRVEIRSTILNFTFENGYSYCHPHEDAKQNAQAIANGLNELEAMKKEQNTRYPSYQTVTS